MCGEKCAVRMFLTSVSGSPPRVRGKVHLLTQMTTEDGITPACAGKRACRHRAAKRRWDHPRVCGEKWKCRWKKVKGLGSPPRVRGKAHRGISRKTPPRITPACAGKRLKKAHKIKDFDPVPIRFHLVFRRFERWCSNLPTPDGNVPV